MKNAAPQIAAPDGRTVRRFAFYAVGAVAAVLLVRKIVLNVKSRISAAQTRTALNVDNNATLTTTQAQNIADSLYQYMRETGGSDDQILSLMGRCKTSGDFAFVYSAFGTKAYGTFGDPLIGSGTQLDLWGWLRHELSSSNWKSLRQTMLDAGVINV